MQGIFKKIILVKVYLKIKKVGESFRPLIRTWIITSLYGNFIF
jgi:hypothetical protein